MPLGAPRPSRPSRAMLAVILLGLVAGCSDEVPLVQLPPPTVTVAVPLQRPVVESVYATGRTVGSEQVEVRARVSGYLDKIYFKPGNFIKQGDPLFEIDARPYQAALNQAKGELERVQARLTRTNLDLARGEKNFSRNVITKEEYDRLIADQAEATATVHTTEAAVERATLDLTWTKINAPIDGLVSRELITVGNLVVADSTPLTTIIRYDPMYVYFDVDEHTVLRIQDMIREGKFKTARHNRVPIQMGLADDTGYPLEGHINFVENRLDRATGTIEVRGEFPNPVDAQGAYPITAGLYARVRMELGAPHDALWISEKSLLSDQDKKYVYIVDDQQKVVRRDVELGPLEAGLRVIENGLTPTDRVILRGLQRVREGIVVSPTETELTPPPQSTIRNTPAADSPAAAKPQPATEQAQGEKEGATEPASSDAPDGQRPVVPIQSNPSP